MSTPRLSSFTDYQKDIQIIARNALLFHLAVMNNSGSTFWAQLHDLASGSGTSAVPVFEIAVPTNNVVIFPFHRDGFQFSNGIYVRAVTTTQGSTLIGGNNAKFTFQYDGPWPLS